MFSFPKTTTVREIQRNYKKVFEEVKRTKQPVVVLKKNRPDIAIVDVQAFDELNKRLEEFEIEDALRSAKRGAEEFKQGKTIKARSLAHLDATYWRNLRLMIERSRALKGKRGNLSAFIVLDRQRH